jgi:hypothetical protein
MHTTMSYRSYNKTGMYAVGLIGTNADTQGMSNCPQSRFQDARAPNNHHT